MLGKQIQAVNSGTSECGKYGIAEVEDTGEFKSGL
jgi:hypothetical protein